MEQAQLLSDQTGKTILPGEQVCITCKKQLFSSHELEDIPAPVQVPEVHQDKEFTEPVTHTADTLNTSLSQLDCSPLKLHEIKKSSRVSYGKRKLKEISDKVGESVAKVLDVPVGNLFESKRHCPDKCKACDDMNDLVSGLKAKIPHSTRNEKLKLLTLAPQSWSIDTVVKEFGVTHYLAKKARNLKKTKGLLADPERKLGHGLPDDEVKLIEDFYQDDEFSRQCPGQKDYVLIRTEQGKIHTQKRMLLVNLKELYIEFKKRYESIKVGFSKFCSLRPRWCVTVDSPGMHSVCVCEIHQNLKLMVAALPVPVTYKELMARLVCSLESRDCMIHRCENCPSKSNLTDYLEAVLETADMDPDDTKNFKQWSHDGHSKLSDMTMSVSEFVHELCEKCDFCTSHHYTAKAQAQYLKKLKDRLPVQEQAIVLVDFAENYSFLCQDAVQGFHWDTSQVTLHPVVVYYRDDSTGDGPLNCKSFCVVSDEREHNAIAVHKFIQVVVNSLKLLLPNLKHLHYFSDGAASQYKNHKNFTNLAHHSTDFAITAEWNFFATSHGKSPCDGIGGTVKRLAARASLQAPRQGQILNSESFFQWCRSNISGIEFIFVSSEEIEEHGHAISDRLATGRTIPGTRSHHKFVPTPDGLKMFRLSADTLSTMISREKSASDLKHSDLKQGQYVAVVYDVKWYIACIERKCIENEDIYVSFMHRCEPSQNLFWPERKEESWVPLIHVLTRVSVPTVSGRSGRQYKLDDDDIKKVQHCFECFKSKLV